MKDPDTQTCLQPITEEILALENLQHTGTPGVSANNRDQGFIPAFLDTETGNVYRSCYPNGRPAPIHMLAGLPEELVDSSNHSKGDHAVIKGSVVSGFILEQIFYSREEAAQVAGILKQLH